MKERLANYTVEPAGIFYGRGEHKLRGKIKKDIYPEDVTLNLGIKDPIPKAPGGHQWKKPFAHEHNATWVAKYPDTITGNTKYIFFNQKSKFKGQSDLKKYETARKLQQNIEIVRTKYMNDANSSNIIKQHLEHLVFYQ